MIIIVIIANDFNGNVLNIKYKKKLFSLGFLSSYVFYVHLFFFRHDSLIIDLDTPTNQTHIRRLIFFFLLQSVVFFLFC
jgi:hypothetical protein